MQYDNQTASPPTYLRWFGNFIARIRESKAALGFTDAEIEELVARHEEYRAAAEEYRNAYEEYQEARKIRGLARKKSFYEVRNFIRGIRSHRNMSDDIRKMLGLTVKKSFSNKQKCSSSKPVLRLESYPGVVIVHAGVYWGNKLRVRKPSWAKSLMVFRKGPGESEFRLIADTESEPFIDYIGGMSGLCTYMARFKGWNESIEGPYSDMVSIETRAILAA